MTKEAGQLIYLLLMLQKNFSCFQTLLSLFQCPVRIQATKERRMGTCRLLGLLLLLPLLLLLLPVLLPPILLHLQTYASLATAFLEHRLLMLMLLIYFETSISLAMVVLPDRYN